MPHFRAHKLPPLVQLGGHSSNRFYDLSRDKLPYNHLSFVIIFALHSNKEQPLF